MKKHSKEKSGIRKIIKNVYNRTGISKIRQHFFEITDMPAYMSKGTSRMSIYDNKNVYIEQYTNVVDYFSHYIRIKCETLYIIIEGKELNIAEISNEDLIITGSIDSISYKKIGGN